MKDPKQLLDEFKNLTNQFEKTLEDKIRSGLTKGLKSIKSSDFINLLNDQLQESEDIIDRINFNKQVQNKAIKEGLDLEKAEILVLAQNAKNNNSIAIAHQKQLMQQKEQLYNNALLMNMHPVFLSELEEKINKHQEEIDNLETQNNLADDLLAKLLKEQEVQQRLLKEQEDLSKAAETIKKIDSEREQIMESINEKAHMMKLIFTDSRAAAAFFTSQLIKGYQSAVQLFGFVREQGMTMSQAFYEVKDAVGDAFAGLLSFSGVGAKESLEVMRGMREEMGTLEEVTRNARIEAGSLALTFGVSAEEAGKLTAQFTMMPNATMETANNTLELAGNMAKAAGVAPGAVLRDMAKSSEEVAAFTKDGGENIAVAAVAAKKMGMEFSQLTKMADQLLDFENSINKQMEASVLLGKEINLDKARQMALNGDLAGMTQEILANVGGEAEFNKMNLLQRKALAESMGVSVADLQKMIKNQDALNDLTQEQQMALATGETTLDEILANAGGWFDRMKNIGSTIFAGVVGLGEFNEGLKAGKELGMGLFNTIKGGIKGMVGGGGLKGGLKGMLGLGDQAQTPEIPKTDAVSAAGKKMGSPGMMLGFKTNMKLLAGGFKEMANPQVLAGIGATALAGPALIIALPAIPFLLFMGLTPLKMLESNLKGLGKGLVSMEKALGGVLVMALAGPALLLAVGAIPFLAFMSIPAIGIGVNLGLKGLASGLKAMGNPQVALGVGILSLLLLSVGASMLMFGVGVGVAAAGMSLLVESFKGLPFESLLALPVAFMGIGAGLYLMAAAGAMALPVIGSLIALAAVAPALVGLGAALGGLFGGGEGEKEDKMDTLIAKIDQLIVVASQGGQVSMDGKKVGEVIRLGLNSAGIR